MYKTKRSMTTEKLVMGALMTALVIIFQLLATYTTFFGPFSTAIALVPIAIGAILCGKAIGAWLGLVFGVVVIATGGAALFFEFSIPGTLITVLLKGSACGFVSGLVYELISKKNHYVAAISASIICPVVNTSVFLLGSAVFFLERANDIAAVVGLEKSGFAVFIALALANFLFELGMCTVLSPIIVKLVDLGTKIRKK